MPVNNTAHLLEFREEDVRYAMQSLLIGKSCALIGVGGIGKTSLLRQLVSTPVRQHYLNGDHHHFIFLPIDAHEVAKPSSLAYYRLMASLLEPVLERNGQLLPIRNPLSMTNEELARQALFDRVDALVSTNEHLILVFFFDEFDVAFTEVEPHFFRVLLALRNRAQGRICYVIASNNMPALICDGRSRKVVREMFVELFNGNVRGIKPFEGRDAQTMLEQDLAQKDQVSPELQRLALEITGAHPGLLKSTLDALSEGSIEAEEQDIPEQIIEKLLYDMPVVSRCEQLWNSLSEIEQYCLKYVRKSMLTKSAIGQHYPVQQINDAIQILQLKGILLEVQRNKLYRCFSALLASYIVQRYTSLTPGLQIDFSRRQVWVDGVLQPGHLTPKEFKLLRYLATHANEVCSREEITRAVYDQEYTSKRDDARLDAVVERARRCIGDDPREPRFLETVRAMGHRLNEYLGERA
ncbi:MAG: winged helix-turn-helix domain-containing protein [Chloroflexi bacterium]|nr:winged helix-turn-helix domain-containing protein [Chloroflexota bacterium]